MKKIFSGFVFLVILSNHLFAQEDISKFPVFNFQKVTEKIFDATLINHVFVWKPDYEERLSFGESDDGYCRTKLDTAIDFTEEKEKYMVLAYSTVEYEKGVPVDCHACTAVISIAVFKKEPDNSFTLRGFKKDFTSTGSFARIKLYSIEKIGPEESVLILQDGDMHFGDYFNTKDYFSLGANELFLKRIFSLTYESGSYNKGESEKVSIKKIPVKNNSFYDLLLTTTKNGKVLPAKDLYTFDEWSQSYRPKK